MAKSNIEAGVTYPQEHEFLPPKSSKKRLFLVFFAGVLACGITQFLYTSGRFGRGQTTHCNTARSLEHDVQVLAPPYVGSTEVHSYPPTHPTNANPTLFPSDVGYPGGTPTGAEPAIIATAPSYPMQTGAAQLIKPDTLGGKGSHSKDFNLFKKWGNLSPWFSVEKGVFGVDSDPTVPETCRVTGLHFLHRHGARYPPAWMNYASPAQLAGRLNKAAANWTATGNLDFLNTWTYKLGEELLTPFGRQQLYDLGISMRLKYGFLLENFTETNTIPVFRTESQDRMLYSALNFALGFFGYPLEGKYQQSITIEALNFSNSLAPYYACPNAFTSGKGFRSLWYLERWAAVYLKKALQRLQRSLKGFELTIEDIYTMQQLCAYETVAIGYSKFCELFTEEEWEGFNYSFDLTFWYDSSFGSPVARVQGYGWIKELVARLTHTKITDHNPATNATLDDNPITFPLDQSLYVDATHDAVVLNIITALNLTNFAASGPLPWTYIPRRRPFQVSNLAPFATNVQFQLLECTSVPGPQIRVIINDGVVPLTSIKGCPEHPNGLCPVATFVDAQRELLAETDWDWGCNGNWTVPEGPEWVTTTGSPPERPS